MPNRPRTEIHLPTVEEIRDELRESILHVRQLRMALKLASSLKRESPKVPSSETPAPKGREARIRDAQ
jgi:hypothetical protein